MSTVKRVARNTSIVMGGNVFFRLISFFVTIYLARYLGVEVWGKYNFAFAYLALFSIITDLGLQTILVREMSRGELNIPKLIGNSLIIRSILTFSAVGLSILTISLLPYPVDTTTYVYIAAFTVLFISFSDFYRTIFEVNLRMEYNMIAKITNRVLSAALIFYIIFIIEGTVTQILLVLVLSEGVKTLINYYFSRGFVKPDYEIDFGLWRYLLRECWPLALSSVIWIIYFRIDVVMLSALVGDAPVGLYSASYKLYEPLSLIPTALVTSLFPIMSMSFKDSKDKLIRIYRLSFKYLLIITIPIAIGTTLLSNKIILLVYGIEFIGSALTLQILIWTFVFNSLSYTLANLLISIDKQKLTALSLTICTIVNIILNLILIPSFSHNGAAITTVITEISSFMISFYFVSKHIHVLPVHRIAAKPVICGLVMGILIYFFNDINLFLIVPMAGLIYLAALLALKTLTEEDWEMIKKVLPKK
ncbi:MAG: flippase [Halobacteriota archaeon]|nr:flippase [Halobacteriota archaeon]